jgi:predicted phage terminase large subunit-like protein
VETDSQKILKNNNNLKTDFLKKIDPELLRIKIESEIGKRNFYEFFKLCIKANYKQIKFIDNWHYKELCDILQSEVERMLRGEKTEKHLLINLPIRCGKTILISEIFPVWLWIKKDSLQIMNVCCTQRLANKSSRLSKIIIESDWFQKRWKIQLSKDNKSKSDYSTTNSGSRISYGVESSIIGASADVIIIDDPNDPSDKNSDIALKNVTEIYSDVIAGRLNNDTGLRIVLQQRTSEKDLCGHLLDNNKDTYRHICIPAILSKETSTEFRNFYKNGLFFPERYGYERLKKYEKDMTPQAYASQLLQTVTAMEGTIIKRIWFKIIKQSDFQLLNKEKIFLFLDTAYTDNKDNDPSAFLICTIANHKLYIIKAVEKYCEFFELIEAIKEEIKIYNINKVYIEGKASGLSVASELKRLLKSRTSIQILQPGIKSKVERANTIQPYLVNGKVNLVQDSWNELFLNQIANFPYGKKDDILDTLVYAVQILIMKSFSNSKLDNNDLVLTNTSNNNTSDIDYDEIELY